MNRQEQYSDDDAKDIYLFAIDLVSAVEPTHRKNSRNCNNSNPFMISAAMQRKRLFWEPLFVHAIIQHNSKTYDCLLHA